MTPPVNVLFIEDNPGDTHLVKEELRLTSSRPVFQLDWVDSLAKGLELLSAKDFQAVLLDLSLPDSAALDTLQRVLSHAPQIPVIVMTGQMDEEMGMRAVQAGAQDYLIKGHMDGRLLTHVIQHAIQRKQTEMQLADALEFTEHILTSSPIGILTFRFTGECVSANAYAAQMVGTTTIEQLKNQNFRELESWKKSGLYELAEKTITTGKPSAADVHVITSFGKESWFKSQFVTFKSAGEELLLLMITDIAESKHAQAGLEASEKRFRAWIENSSDLVTVVNLNGIVQYQSPSAAHLLGYTHEEVLGMGAFDLVHPEDRDNMIALFAESLQNPSDNISLQCRIRHRDGSWRFMEAIARTYTDEFGEMVALINSRDITERKQTEAAIAALQKRFQGLIENAPDGIALLGLDGKLRQVTPSTQQILGYTLEEAQGQDPANLTHPDDLPALLDLLTDLIQHPGKVVTTQYRFKHKDGSWRWLEGTISNLVAEPSIEAIVFNYRDITDRKQAEAALRDSETRYRALMQESVEAIYLYELETKRVIVANPAFWNLLGYTAEEAQELTLYDIVAHDRSSVDRYLQQVLVEGGISIGERLWRRKDGTTVSVEVTASKLQQSGRDIMFVVGRDITERKRAEEALREKERLLSEAQRIGHIGSWSYEIRTDKVRFSDEMYRLLDILPEEFRHTSQDFLDLIYASDRPAAAKWMQDIKTGVQARELDFRIFRKNGELRYLHCTGAVHFDGNGQPVRFIGTAQDVTERKMAEIQINQQIKRLTALGEIDRAIISGFDQRQTLGIILSHVISQLQIDAADVFLLDSEERMLEYAAGQGFRTKLMETTRLQINENYAGRVAQEQRLIHIPDLRERPTDPLFDRLVAEEGFVGYMGVPLIIKGKVKGVLEVFRRLPLQPYQEWLDFLDTLAGQMAIAIENATLFGNLQASNLELTQAYDATIEGWSRAMDLRDKETEGHTRRVTSLSLELARTMGMNGSQLLHLRHGALLHDIGKLGVPDHILHKQDNLTPEEWEIMRKHPDLAYEMLAPITYLKPALAIPYYHHERWDGSGYPLGLKGEQIPLEARIFAVVDVWDALRSDRPYRKAWSAEEALEHIRAQAGRHFDPEVVECFLKVVKY